MWIDVNFLNQNPGVPSYLCVFEIGIFLSVAPSESRYMSASGASSSSSYTRFMLFIHSAFLLFFSFQCFTEKLFSFIRIRLLMAF